MTSIRQQLTRDLFLVLTAVATLVVAAMFVGFWQMLLESFDGKLRADASAVAALTEFEAGKVSNDFSPEFLSSYSGKKPRSFFELRDAQGAVLVRSPSLGEADLPSTPGEGMRAARFSNIELPKQRAGRLISFSFVPESTGTEPQGPAPTVHLSVAVDRHELNETLVGAFFGGAVGLGILIGAIFLVVPRVLDRGLQPMVQLAERAAAIDANSLSTRFEVRNIPAELQPVSQRLNDLLSRLESSFERERRFSADLAHELRTPLAELRSMSECALKWPDQRDPAFEQETLLVAKHMEALVAQLLALTRGEENGTASDRQVIDVSALITSTWKAFIQRAGQQQLQVKFSASPGILAKTDPALLRAILINVFDNAVSYTPSHGEISVALTQPSDRVRIEISNEPVDLETADVGKMFDRFWRKESARSDKTHFGLGLSLCRSFATTMDWKISAQLAARRLVIVLEPRPS